MAFHVVRLKDVEDQAGKAGYFSQSCLRQEGIDGSFWSSPKKQGQRAIILVAAILAVPELAGVVATYHRWSLKLLFHLIKAKFIKKLSSSVGTSPIQLFSGHMCLMSTCRIMQARYSYPPRKFHGPCL